MVHFRCVDPGKADAGATNINGIAVDDPGAAPQFLDFDDPYLSGLLNRYETRLRVQSTFGQTLWERFGSPNNFGLPLNHHKLWPAGARERAKKQTKNTHEQRLGRQYSDRMPATRSNANWQFLQFSRKWPRSTKDPVTT